MSGVVEVSEDHFSADQKDLNNLSFVSKNKISFSTCVFSIDLKRRPRMSFLKCDSTVFSLRSLEPKITLVSSIFTLVFISLLVNSSTIFHSFVISVHSNIMCRLVSFSLQKIHRSVSDNPHSFSLFLL